MSTNYEPVINDKPQIPSLSDFVFLDDASRPYRVRKTNEGLWMYFWNEGSKSWVTLRIVDPVEAMKLYMRRSLNREQTLLYEAGVPFLTA